MTVRDKKKQLINQEAAKDKDTLVGMKLTRRCTMAILFSRIALTIYDAIYIGIAGLEPAVMSYVFFAIGILLCYLFFDGNRAVGYILFIAAMVRILYHLVSVLPALPEGTASVVFSVITLAVLAMQALLSLLPTVNPKCLKFSNAMQRVNLEISRIIRSSNPKR